MKKIILFFSILGAILFASCSNEIDVPDNPLALKNQVTFNSTIGERTSGTRASGTAWDSGDAIGVYALNEGQALPGGIYNEKANVKYTTPNTDGIFTAAVTSEAITFPDEGNLDFIAYYPYQETITDYKYTVDVSTQTDPAAIDLLYSDDAKGANKGEPEVSMTFKHKLSQLILNISQGDGIESLEGLTLKIENLKTDGNMNLADGTVTLGNAVSAISPSVQTDEGGKAMVAAILVPGQDLSGAKLTFTLDGKNYEWTPDAQALESGKKYTYPLQLSLTGLITLQPGATIEDWEDGFTGTEDIILTPDGEADEYLSIADLRAMFTGQTVTIPDDVKAKAVVVQNRDGGNSTSKKNLVVQDETAGIAIRFEEDDETFNFGDEVEISLQGQQLSEYNGLLQINNLLNENMTKLGTKTVEPKEITAAELLSGNFESQYVAVANVQVVAADLGKTFASSTAHGSINMESESGENFVMFTSQYASFKEETVPEGSGTLKGIASINKDVYQILPTVKEDYAGMTNPRFGVTDILTVSPESIQFEATAGDKKEIAVTASGAWTAKVEGSGFSVSSTTGTGDATVTATADAADAASGKIVFTLDGTSLTKEVVVSQKSGGTGEVQEFFKETFDNAAPEKTKFNSEGTSVSGFDFAEGKYTGTGADVRTTSLIGKHVWFPAFSAAFAPAFLNISNIPSGYTNIKLTYDIAANGPNVPAKGLMIKCNDTEITPPDVILGEQNAFSTITLNIPIDDVIVMEFYTDNTNTKGFRLDNVKLEGVKK